MTEEEELREIARSSHAAQMEMLGYQADGNPKDMVEVVRCKDCKYFFRRGSGLYCQFIGCEKTGAFHKEEWFCADGERR